MKITLCVNANVHSRRHSSRSVLYASSTKSRYPSMGRPTNRPRSSPENTIFRPIINKPIGKVNLPLCNGQCPRLVSSIRTKKPIRIETNDDHKLPKGGLKIEDSVDAVDRTRAAFIDYLNLTKALETFSILANDRTKSDSKRTVKRLQAI
jgi:hypothetical protein